MSNRDRFVRLRKRANLTQASAAKAIGMSRRSIESIEQGARGCSDEVLEKLRVAIASMIK